MSSSINFSVWGLSFGKGLFFTALLIFCFPKEQIFANDPKISIQGTLKNANGNTVSDGTYLLTFKLYHQATGGSSVWEEAGNVDVVGGVYSYLLGTTVALDPNVFSNPVWLGVVIEGFELSPRTEFSYSPYSFSVEFAQKVACSGAVGDVKYSILNPAQFADQNGDCWVPMDGRNIVGSVLNSVTGMSSVPDAGGVFFRAQEFDGGADRDPNRTSASAIGQVQGQAVQAHGHNVNDPGHSHPYLDRRQSGGAGAKCGCAGQSNPASQNTADDSRTTNSSTTSISIPSTGNGPETRPVNMNLWTYIRIN